MALTNTAPTHVIIFLSIMMGIIFSIIYDFFQVFISLSKQNDMKIFIADILFWIIVSNLMFLFLLATNYGVFRFYILFTATIGFFLYRVSIGCMTVNILKKLFHIISKLYRRLIAELLMAFIKDILECVLTFLKSTFKNLKSLFFTGSTQSKT